MERIEEIDKDGNTIAVHPKDFLKTKMFLHKVSMIIPRGEDGTFILSRRAKDKHPFPDTRCCAIGGKVAVGESFEEAAIREGQEEAGLALELEEVVRFLYDEDDYKALFAVYTTKEPILLSAITCDPAEIQSVRAYTLEEMSAVAQSNQNNPTFREAVKVFISKL